MLTYIYIYIYIYIYVCVCVCVYSVIFRLFVLVVMDFNILQSAQTEFTATKLP